MHEGSLLPRHSSTLYRRNVVSFGAIVYFLRAVYEHGRRTGDSWTRGLFRSGVEHMLAGQGPQGEWPWLYSVATGKPAELYPVYAVHQDSMAHLFLLPALDQGIPGVRPAIERSLAWCFGANELGEPMYVDDAVPRLPLDPAERPFPRAGRYLRAVRGIATGRPAVPAAGPTASHINRGVPLVPPGLDPLRLVGAARSARRARPADAPTPTGRALSPRSRRPARPAFSAQPRRAPGA